MILSFAIVYCKTKNRYRISSAIFCVSRSYPHCIDQWTQDHVKWFLLSKNLDSLLPVFVNMNGLMIHEIYIMCKKDRNLMFQTMKDEVANDGQQKPLTLSTYLCFLDEIQKYIPHKPGENSPSSVVCTLM